MCPKCHNFPLIQYINEREIYYTCGCIKKKQMKIKELFDNENKYFLIEKSSSKSSTRASSFSSGETLVPENSKEYKSKNNKNSIGFYCSKHNSKKFRYFCTTCKVNLCKECIESHLGKEHNKIVFDFVNPNDTKPIFIAPPFRPIIAKTLRQVKKQPEPSPPFHYGGWLICTNSVPVSFI